MDRDVLRVIERCPQQSDLDGLRSYRESIEHIESSLMDQESDEKLSSLILKNLDRQPSYREASRSCRACLKTVFQRIEKHKHECNQTCYSTKNPTNILSCQKHISSRKMSSIQIQNTHTHTHTHTLNKSNQFYILKTSQDSLVSIH